MTVHYQIAEIPQGLLVRGATGSTCPRHQDLPAVTPGRTFLLKTVANATTGFFDRDSARAMLTSGVEVTMDPADCGGHDIQAVDWNGITVTRGNIVGSTLHGLSTYTVSSLPAASVNTALLIQPEAGLGSICHNLMHRSIASPTSLTLSRGAGATACTTSLEGLTYERIDFGQRAKVQQVTSTFVAGETSASVSITAVDPSRPLVFASSQIAGGQGVGETDYNEPGVFTVGAFQTVLTNSTSVSVWRPPTTARAIVTMYVVELLP